METCFVYLRKSTNRKDRQQYSFEMQLEWINNLLLENPHYKVIWLDWNICDIPSDWFIYESESAIQWWKPRPLFYKLIDAINKYECDNFLVWQPSRISRNIDDTSIFIKLFEWKDKKIHKLIRTEFIDYDVNQARHVSDLEIALADAKKDNVYRSLMAKGTHKTQRKKWIRANRLPFWYKQKEWKGVVQIDTEEMLLVELAFNMRLNWCSFKEISDEFLKKWYKKRWDWISKILSNPVYTGRFYFNWEENAITNYWYKMIIDKVVFDKVQKYNEENKRKHWTSNINKSKNQNNHYLDKMVFDIFWKALQPYKSNKTWKIYYRQSTKNYTYIINISEQKLFNEADKYIKNLSFQDEVLVIFKEIFLSKISILDLEQEAIIIDIKSKVNIKNQEIENRISEVWKITDERIKTRFMNSLSILEDEIEILQKQLSEKENKNINYEEIVNNYLEIFKDLPWTYKKSPKNEKANILRWLWVKFIVWIDKTITIEGIDINNFLKL